MRIGRYQINRYIFERTYVRRIKPLFNRSYSLDRSDSWGKTNPMDIFTTNVCNLKCYSCSALCDKPMGGNVLRLKPYVIGLGELEDFLINIKPWYNWIRITGGEPTTMPLDHLKELIVMAHDYGFKVDLLTNGFKLAEYLDRYLGDYPDHVTLDRHGVNSTEIAKGVAILKNTNIPYRLLDVLKHRDLEYQRTGNITKAAKCPIFLNNVSVANDVVYPCCAGRVVEAWDNTNAVSDALRVSGWSTRNTDLVKTIQNWRDTLPADWWKICLLRCWMDGDNIRYEKTQ